jgi:hypothetical protein
MLNSPTRRLGAHFQRLMTLPQAAARRQLKHRRQIGRCHALKSDGDVVRLYYPRWHRAAAAPTPSD